MFRITNTAIILLTALGFCLVVAGIFAAISGFKKPPTGKSPV
jgi:uncharacterized membrane protein HdeD (DUF308 family)